MWHCLHLQSLGFCDYECHCNALLRARDVTVVGTGMAFPDVAFPKHGKAPARTM